MAKFGNYKLISADLGEDHIATVEMQNGELNFFDLDMLTALADCFADLDKEAQCRVILLASGGRAFCAGANFAGGTRAEGLNTKTQSPSGSPLYDQAVRLFSNKKPIVGAVNGAAIGGGLGLCLVPDFRVASPEARFSANFTQLGFHPGFGLTYTLPALVGQQKAWNMLFTGRRVKADEALEMGLVDRLAPSSQLRETAREMALEIASASPLGVMATRESVRMGLADKVRAATARELQEQNKLQGTEDMKEGIRATAERRPAKFVGR
ncbi:MAG TPA: enoyl-CoA hydratase [Alphaproteobacteria bacterium]|jgi:enoyl-CoA hydratase/carnithine racemase|nr:enoyl-CoA hydratase [Alphaproteobacteria bacterium]